MKKIILLCCVVGLTGCYKSEWEAAKAESEQAKSQGTQLQSELGKANRENDQLKADLAQSKAEIAKLEETAQYHFQKGQENLKTGQYAEAVESFKTVIARFPNDRLVIPAQKSLMSAQKIFAAEAKSLMSARKIFAAEAAKKARGDAEAGLTQRRAESAREAQANARRNAKFSKSDHQSMNGHCAGQGKPPRGYIIRGGTYDENDKYAESQGCVPLQDGESWSTMYCCP